MLRLRSKDRDGAANSKRVSKFADLKRQGNKKSTRGGI